MKITNRFITALSLSFILLCPASTLAQSDQLASHKKAEKDAGKAIISNSLSAALHLTAFINCIWACTQKTTVTFLGAEVACKTAVLSAAGLDIAQTLILQTSFEETMKAITFAGGSATAVYLSTMGAEKATEAAAKEAANSEACIGAISEGTVTAIKTVMIFQSKKKKDEAKKAQQDLIANAPSPNFVAEGAEFGALAPKQVAGLDGIGTPIEDAISEESDFGDCTGPKEEGDGEAFVQCAIANGATLPEFFEHTGALENPEVLDKIGEFVQQLPNDFNPNDVIAKGLADAFGGDEAAIREQLANGEKEILAAMESSEAASTYAGGGAGKGRGGKKESINKQIENLIGKTLGQFAPKDKKTKKQTSSEIEFKLANLSADQISKERGISLFKRIQYRYKKVRPQLRQLPWTTRYNRITAGGELSRGRTPAAKTLQ